MHQIHAEGFAYITSFNFYNFKLRLVILYLEMIRLNLKERKGFVQPQIVPKWQSLRVNPNVSKSKIQTPNYCSLLTQLSLSVVETSSSKECAPGCWVGLLHVLRLTVWACTASRVHLALAPMRVCS